MTIPSKRRLCLWPGGIFALIGLNLVVVGATIYASSVSRTPVDPAYTEAELPIDRESQARMNRSLGWQIQADLVPSSASTPLVHTRLIDSEGKPIRSAHIGVEAIFAGQPQERVEAILATNSDGTYQGALALRPGLWTLAFEATASGLRYTQEVAVNVTTPGEPARSSP